MPQVKRSPNWHVAKGTLNLARRPFKMIDECPGVPLQSCDD